MKMKRSRGSLTLLGEVLIDRGQGKRRDLLGSHSSFGCLPMPGLSLRYFAETVNPLILRVK
jgi:hypothetical protein